LALLTGVAGLAIGYLVGAWSASAPKGTPTLGNPVVDQAKVAPAARLVDPVLPPDAQSSNLPDEGVSPTDPLGPAIKPPPAPAGFDPDDHPDKAVITGRVVDWNGRPPPKAIVGVVRVQAGLHASQLSTWLFDQHKQIDSRSVLARTTCGADGTFSLVTEPGSDLALVASTAVSGVGIAAPLALGSNGPFTLRVPTPPSPYFRGVVRDFEGNRIAGAKVTIGWSGEGAPKQDWTPSTTNARGEYRSPPLCPYEGGPTTVIGSVKADGVSLWPGVQWDVARRVIHRAAWGKPGLQEIVWNPIMSRDPVPARVRGRVRMRDGSALPEGVRVTAQAVAVRLGRSRPSDNEQELAFGEEGAPEIGADGAFELKLRAAGEVYLAASGETVGMSPRMVGVVKPGGLLEGVELLLDRGPTVQVVVPDGTDEWPGVWLRYRDGGAKNVDGAGTPGMSGQRPARFSVPMNDQRIIPLPWGLSGRWYLEIWPEDERKWAPLQIPIDGAAPPSQVELVRNAVVLDVPVSTSDARGVPDVTVEGTWSAGGSEGRVRVYVEWKGEGARLRALVPRGDSDVRLAFTLRCAGYRPVVIGPATLQPGSQLAVKSVVFSRD
jgi:hypothetical protein